jgi:hypothetical protein
MWNACEGHTIGVLREEGSKGERVNRVVAKKEVHQIRVVAVSQ